MAFSKLQNPMTRPQLADLMYPGLHKAYIDYFEHYPEEYTKFLNVESSTKRQEEDLVMEGFGLIPEKTEGDTPIYDVLAISDKLQYLHKTYVLGYEASEELIEDELYSVLSKASGLLAKSVKLTCDTLGAAVLNNAFSASYLGVDGKALCATDHPQAKISGGTVANRPTTETDFDPVALQAALLTWEQWEDANGIPMLYTPKYVISGPAQRDIITRTLGSTQYPGTNDNDINSIRTWELEKMILHYLTDDDAWFIMAPLGDTFLKWFWRVKPAFRGWDDPETGNARYTVRFRASCGFTHWPGIWGTTGI